MDRTQNNGSCIDSTDNLNASICEVARLRASYEKKKSMGSVVDLADGLHDLGLMFSELRRYQESNSCLQEALQFFFTLAAAEPKLFRESLGECLNSLSVILAIQGQFDAAMPASQLALTIARALYHDQPAVFAAKLALSLSNVGYLFGELRRHGEALKARQEAVELYRVLYKTDQESFADDLAGSLFDLSLELSELGQRDDAMQVRQETVHLYRTLHEAKPEEFAFASKLASSLDFLGDALHVLERLEEALQATQEAVSLRRALHQAEPESFTAELANGLHNLGVRLSRLCRHKEALQANLESVRLYRSLQEGNPEAFDFSSNLASALSNLGYTLSMLGSYEFALQATHEAVSLRRTLHQAESESYTADLAADLNALGLRFSELGRYEEALQANLESVSLYRALQEGQPESFAYSGDFGRSLNALGIALSAFGRREEALQSTQDAIRLRRALYQSQPDSIADDLGMDLCNLSSMLNALDRHEEALQASQESVALLRSIYQSKPEVYSAKLAHCLQNLSCSLGSLGLGGEAFQAGFESFKLYADQFENQPDVNVKGLALSFQLMGVHFDAAGRHDDALLWGQKATLILRLLYQNSSEVNAADLASCLHNLGFILDVLGRDAEAQSAWHEAGVVLVSQESMNPQQWCARLSAIARNLTSTNSLRQIHLAAVRRLADLRRVPHFDSLAGPALIALQALLVADLWKKLAAAGEDDPELMDDTLPVLLSALQSPDLMRWLAANQNDSPEGRALTLAQSEFLQAYEVHAQLIARLRGDRDGNSFSGGGMRQAPTAQQVSATEVELSAASQREGSARAALHRAEEQLAKADPAFASAYEIPTIHELHAMLAHLRQASSAQHKSAADTAALLCFLELPAHADQAPRLVGVLLSSESAQARQIEFPGLQELAQKFEHYKPLGQRSSQSLRQLRDNTPPLALAPSQSEQTTPQDFELLLSELEQLWWSPLATALGKELVSLKVLHLCSHGIAHQLPFSQVSYLSLGGNVQLLQWPGLPYLRLAYDKGYTSTATEVQTAPALWQVAHDCAWHGEVPLPMVAVEAHLLRHIIDKDKHVHGHSAQAIEAPEQIQSNAHALVVCSHGSKAQGVNSAVRLKGGGLTTGEVMRRKLGPRMALIPACHAADTADDHAHNALGVAAGFLLSGSRLVVGSIKAVPDTLMPWFSTLLTWYVVHEELGLHAAAVRARQDFGAGEFPAKYVRWIKANLPQALACLHPHGEESQHWADSVPKDSLKATVRQWPWQAMDKDALVPKRPVDLQTMQAAAQKVAANAFVPLGPQTRQQMREMAAFLVVFGMG